MALKRKLDKDAFAALSKSLKAEYIENSDGDYVLDVDGDEDTGALKRAKDRAVQESKDHRKRADEAEAKLADLDTTSTRESGDMAKMEKIWQGKLDKVTEDAAAKQAQYDATTSASLINNAANAMAAKISTSPALLLPHIKARLQADLTTDTPITTFHDGNGASIGMEALEKEFVDNKDFASIIIASKAKGGGAPDKSQRMGGAPQTQPGDKPAPLSDLSGSDLVARLDANKEAND